MSPRSGQKEVDITISNSSVESPSLEGWCVQMKSVLTKADPLSRSSTILIEDRFAASRRSPVREDGGGRPARAPSRSGRLRGGYDEEEEEDLDVADDDDDDDDDEFDEDFDEFDDDFDEDDDLDDDFDDEED